MPKYTPTIIGTGQLQRHTAQVLNSIAKSSSESFVVTNNRPTAVLMSIERYEKLKALEEITFLPHQPTAIPAIRKAFQETGYYSEAFIDDLASGLKKTSLYHKAK